MGIISEQLSIVEENIKQACKRAGRDRSEVTLIAVSKTKPVEMLKEAYDAGIREFGENKVQEICAKLPALPDDIHWHMIGHLQTNKVKYIANSCALIHSVDSLHLAKEIDKQGQKCDRLIPILLEVNIANEASKFGISAADATAFVRQVSELSYVAVRGLMTIAPYVTDPEENRLYFRQIRQLSVDIASQNIDNVSMDVLSMGMTGDYAVAIEEGATMVRVGTGIFGERFYPNQA